MQVHTRGVLYRRSPGNFPTEWPIWSIESRMGHGDHPALGSISRLTGAITEMGTASQRAARHRQRRIGRQ